MSACLLVLNPLSAFGPPGSEVPRLLVLALGTLPCNFEAFGVNDWECGRHGVASRAPFLPLNPFLHSIIPNFPPPYLKPFETSVRPKLAQSPFHAGACLHGWLPSALSILFLDGV